MNEASCPLKHHPARAILVDGEFPGRSKKVRSENARDRLIAAALAARKHAYSPYSGRFKVGSAVLTGDGHIYTGCNVENASFGATVCAERVAVLKAVSDGHRRITAVAIVVDSPEPIPPCGVCLQVLNEFGRAADIFAATTAGKLNHFKVSDLLPVSFEFKTNKE